MSNDTIPAPADSTVEPIAFDPVPLAFRHNGWSPKRQAQFIAALQAFGAVTTAARALGMSARSAYALRDRPGAESFAAAWDLALDIGRDRLFEEAIRRGRDGYLRPVTYGGIVIGQRRVYDNRLLFAACYARPMSP